MNSEGKLFTIRFLQFNVLRIQTFPLPRKYGSIQVMSEHNSNSNQSAPENNKEKEPKRPKLKILAFHGYRQNGAVFRAKIGSFRKAVSKYAQLTFFSAPHRVVNEDGGGDEGKDMVLNFSYQINSNKLDIRWFHNLIT